MSLTSAEMPVQGQSLTGVAEASVAPWAVKTTVGPQNQSIRLASAPGRNQVSARALSRVITAVAAATLEVDSRQISVDLKDFDGTLRVSVRAPIRIPSANRVLADPEVVSRTGGTVLERAALAQQHIRTRSQSLSGSEISCVVLQLIGAVIHQERRVR